MSSNFRFFTLLCCAASVAAATPASNAPALAFTPTVSAIVSPAGEGSVGPSLTKAPDGTIYLSWIEPAGKTGHALKIATLDRQERKWSAPRTVAQGSDWFVNFADFPALAAEKDGRLTAVWFVRNPEPAIAPGAPVSHQHHGPGYHARISQSADRGLTWSPATPLTRESDRVEFVSLQPLADGRLLAVWLDGRGTSKGAPMQLYSRLIGSTGPDLLVDPSVCDCCQTALTAFPDGSALVAYRGRTNNEIRDTLTARFADDRWERQNPSTSDGWKITGCPVNGPRIASDGPRVVAAWFTAENSQPRVLVASSSDAGSTFSQAHRADLGQTVGRLDTLLLNGGTQLVSWIETAVESAGRRGGLYLRRYGAGGATMTPALLVDVSTSRTTGFPRMIALKDFDATPAEIVVAYTVSKEKPRVETLLVTLPDAASLAAADSLCECAPRAEELAGFPVRGRVVDVGEGRPTLRLEHHGVPGVMRAGQREFRAAPNVITALRPEREILARIEQRDGEWWVFDVRVLLSKQR